MSKVRDLTPAEVPELTALYAEYEWWEDREETAVRAALSESEVAVGVEVDGDLVAAARVLTDYRYYANLFDVVVAQSHRGEGIGEPSFAPSSSTPTYSRLSPSRCFAGAGSCRFMSPPASTTSSRKRRFRRMEPRYSSE